MDPRPPVARRASAFVAVVVAFGALLGGVLALDTDVDPRVADLVTAFGAGLAVAAGVLGRAARPPLLVATVAGLAGAAFLLWPNEEYPALFPAVSAAAVALAALVVAAAWMLAVWSVPPVPDVGGPRSFLR